MVELIRRHLIKLFAVSVGVAVIDHGEVDTGISCRGRTRQRILEDEAFFFGKAHILEHLEVDGRAWLDLRRILLRLDPRKAGIKRCFAADASVFLPVYLHIAAARGAGDHECLPVFLESMEHLRCARLVVHDLLQEMLRYAVTLLQNVFGLPCRGIRFPQLLAVRKIRLLRIPMLLQEALSSLLDIALCHGRPAKRLDQPEVYLVPHADGVDQRPVHIKNDRRLVFKHTYSLLHQEFLDLRISFERQELLLRRIDGDVAVMVHEAEEAQDVSCVRAKLMPLPWRDGDEIPFPDFMHITAKKRMALPFEDQDEVHVLMLFQRREAVLLHLKITELHRKVGFVVKKDLLRHIAKDPGIFLVNMGRDALPAIRPAVKFMDHGCSPYGMGSGLARGA